MRIAGDCRSGSLILEFIVKGRGRLTQTGLGRRVDGVRQPVLGGTIEGVVLRVITSMILAKGEYQAAIESEDCGIQSAWWSGIAGYSRKLMTETKALENRKEKPFYCIR